MRRLLLAVSVASVFSGCRGGGAGIGDGASRSLDPKIAEVRAAAEAHRPDTVTAKLAEVRAEVKKLQEHGELDEVAAERILAAAGRVEDSLMLITTTTAQPRPSTTPARPTTTKPQDTKDQDEKRGGGGKKNDEEKD